MGRVYNCLHITYPHCAIIFLFEFVMSISLVFPFCCPACLKIFYQMLFSAIDLASFIFAIDEKQGMSPSNATAVVGASTVLLPTFLFCMLSENVTLRLQEIGDAFYGCSWYYLDARQQRLFLLPIQRAQKELRLNGLNIVNCSLEIFSRVNAVPDECVARCSINLLHLSKCPFHFTRRSSEQLLRIFCSCAVSIKRRGHQRSSTHIASSCGFF